MSFLMFRHILEKFLFEKMCLELKTALKNVLKIIPEAFFEKIVRIKMPPELF